jgi:hypothetical protein
MASSDEPRKRKIVLLDVNGSPYPGLEIDVTAIPNANSQAPFYLVTQELCNLLHWHERSRVIVEPWGSD